MLDRCRKILDAEREALGSAAASTHFHLLDAECALPAAQFDFVYFFDVLVHVDADTQFRYYAQLPKVAESVFSFPSLLFSSSNP